jgi:thiol-disulfide isomerase/thioredoxin
MNHLTKKDFDSKDPQRLRKQGISVVKFYAEWCGHCRSSQPEYELLAKIAGKDFNICMYEADPFLEVINNSSLHGFKVQGYPTYIIFVNGIFQEDYKGPRTARAILDRLLQLRTSLSLW